MSNSRDLGKEAYESALRAHDQRQYKKAAYLFDEAIGHGNANAMRYRGLMHFQGHGCEINYIKALELLARALENSERTNKTLIEKIETDISMIFARVEADPSIIIPANLFIDPLTTICKIGIISKQVIIEAINTLTTKESARLKELETESETDPTPLLGKSEAEGYLRLISLGCELNDPNSLYRAGRILSKTTIIPVEINKVVDLFIKALNNSSTIDSCNARAFTALESLIINKAKLFSLDTLLKLLAIQRFPQEIKKILIEELNTLLTQELPDPSTQGALADETLLILHEQFNHVLSDLTEAIASRDLNHCSQEETPFDDETLLILHKQFERASTTITEAIFSRGLLYYKKNDFINAINFFDIACKANNPNAMIYRAKMHIEGNGSAIDIIAAAKLLFNAPNKLPQPSDLDNNINDTYEIMLNEEISKIITNHLEVIINHLDKIPLDLAIKLLTDDKIVPNQRIIKYVNDHIDTLPHKVFPKFVANDSINHTKLPIKIILKLLYYDLIPDNKIAELRLQRGALVELIRKHHKCTTFAKEAVEGTSALAKLFKLPENGFATLFKVKPSADNKGTHLYELNQLAKRQNNISSVANLKVANPVDELVPVYMPTQSFYTQTAARLQQPTSTTGSFMFTNEMNALPKVRGLPLPTPPNLEQQGLEPEYNQSEHKAATARLTEANPY